MPTVRPLAQQSKVAVANRYAKTARSVGSAGHMRCSTGHT